MRKLILLMPLLLGLTFLCCEECRAQQMPERSLVRKGNRQFNKGKYEKSIERYEQALKEVPSLFEANYNLGNALYKAERYDHAEKQMKVATADSLQNEQTRAEAFYNLGNAQFKQKKYQEALQSYRQSLRLNPDDQEAKYNYAYTKRLLKEEEQKQQQNQDQNKDQQQNQNQQQQNQQNQQQQGGENQKDQNKENQDQNQDQQSDKQNGEQNPSEQEKAEEQQGDEGEGQAVPVGISKQEQEQMLDAIQAQEDKTQEKLKEKRKGVMVRVKKNW